MRKVIRHRIAVAFSNAADLCAHEKEVQHVLLGLGDLFLSMRFNSLPVAASMLQEAASCRGRSVIGVAQTGHSS